jgi:CPA2 family monovalent cation:H+ antiporter-2
VSTELHLILNVAMAVAIALVDGLVAQRLRYSVIVGYLLAGMVISPFTPGFVGDRAQITALRRWGPVQQRSRLEALHDGEELCHV